jgi:Tfp pilus assembly PilM family ATPase
MTLFPLTRPQTSLYITAKKVSLAQLKVGWSSAQLRQYTEHSLPSGMVRLSPLAVNIQDPEAFGLEMQEFLGNHQTYQSVALSLSDLCARTAIFELSTLPKNPKECQALLSWRFKQDFNITTANTRMTYKIFKSSEVPTLPSQPSSVRILASTIQHNIIESYEKVCLQAGFIPVTINLATLTVFDWCRKAMDHFQKTLPPVNDNLLIFCYLADWGFSLLVLQHHVPIFLRIKPIQASTPLPLSTTSLSSTGQSPPDKPQEATLDESLENVSESEEDLPHTQTHSKNIAHELIATLQFFFETKYSSGNQDVQDSSIPLFLVGGESPQVILPSIGEEVEKTFNRSESGLVSIKPIPLYTHEHNNHGQTMGGITLYSDSILPTIACPVVAT